MIYSLQYSFIMAYNSLMWILFSASCIVNDLPSFILRPFCSQYFCLSFYSRKVGFTYHYRHYFPAGTKGRLITPSSCLPPLAVIISSVSNAMISICGVLYSSFMTPCCILVRSFKLFFISNLLFSRNKWKLYRIRTFFAGI